MGRKIKGFFLGLFIFALVALIVWAMVQLRLLIGPTAYIIVLALVFAITMAWIY